MMTFRILLFSLGRLVLTHVAFAEAPQIFPHPDRIKYDAQCVQIDGKDTFIYSGAFHYFRVPKELWRDRFQKIKDAGFNGVETYVPWNWHERQAPKSPEDFSKLTGMQDLDEWISMAEQFGLYVTIRPGPYICAEWSGGGIPQWLVALKKPAGWPAGKSWLQTDDPTWLAWSKHWYAAVSRVVAPHQITRKRPGQTGVIFFQIENEYERLNWLPGVMKTRYLEELAKAARMGGIDVPLVTCWTKQSRNVQSGPLQGVFDFVNAYPKWNVKAQLDKYTRQQRKEQPNAPLASMELQGGWYSAIGGKLSDQIDGIAAVQTQNLTLYALQLGFTVINYYMLVGGTNFDDWASREATATYDFGAAIHENGGVNERYARVWGIGHMLREHGPQLARALPLEFTADISDPAVEVAGRKSPDGARFFFVRTEDRTAPHRGVVHVAENGATPLSFDFQLEPFGSMVLYLPPGAKDAKAGEWLPRSMPALSRPKSAPAPITLTSAESIADPLPTKWTALEPGDTLEANGVLDHHLVYYRVKPPAGQPFTVERIGDKIVSGTGADGVLAWVGGKLLPAKTSDAKGVTFEMPSGANEATLLFESRGLHQHTKPELEDNWLLGIRGVKSDSQTLPLQFATSEREHGIAVSNPKVAAFPGAARVVIGRDAPTAASESLLTWYRMTFSLPAKTPGVWMPWKLHLKAEGNGFLYLNGHCLGRYWQEGPQRDFHLPECWLNFGPGATNAVALGLRPVDKDAQLQAATVEPCADFAELRP